MDAHRTLRLLLMKNEVMPLPAGYRRLRVRSGRAWLTVAGMDLTMQRGQEVGLESKADKALISTLGELPAVVELLPAPSKADGRRPSA